MAPGDLITQDWQIEWRGGLLGKGTPFLWRNLSGWLELPNTRIQRVGIAGRHGSYAGQLLSTERVITFDAIISPGLDRTGASFVAAVDQLRVLTALDEAPAPEPLTIQVSGERWMVNAQCDRRSLPIDGVYNAQSSHATIEWVAPDPRLYSPGAVQSLTTGMANPVTGGLVFPLVFPLTFGASIGGGGFTLTNVGTITTWPTWVLTGPLTGPSITNINTGQSLIFDPTFTIAAGQTLIVNADARTVTLSGVNRRDKLITANWFGLIPGTTQVQFNSIGSFDPAASLTAQWRHATI